MLLRFTILLFLPTLLSGIALIGTPGNEAQDSAVIAWLHVVIGWVALPVFVIFAANHTYRRWQPAVSSRRQSGSMGLLVLAMLLLSGVEIGEPLLGLPLRLAGWLHLLTTLALLAFLVVHLQPVVRRLFRGSTASLGGDLER